MKIDKNNTSTSDDSSTEELENKLASKEKTNKELEKKLKETQERLHDVIVDKRSLEKTVKELELKELSLQLGKFDELKNEYSKLEHRTQITKKQLDDVRNQIQSLEKYVIVSKNQVDFMKKVIDVLESRGLADYLRKRFPETFIEYKNKQDR